MALNPAGPYVLTIPTVTDNLVHDITLNVDILGTAAPGADPADVTLRNKGGGGIFLDTAVNQFWAKVRPLFASATLAATYTLSKVTSTNNEREFISAGTLAVPNGEASAYVPAGQFTCTWRSGRGGIAKLVLLETNFPGNTRSPLAAVSNPAVSALNLYVLSADNILCARDRSFPVAAMNLSLGQNEKVFNRRYRS